MDLEEQYHYLLDHFGNVAKDIQLICCVLKRQPVALPSPEHVRYWIAESKKVLQDIDETIDANVAFARSGRGMEEHKKLAKETKATRKIRA